MEKIEINENVCKQDAKNLVDLLFDKRLFADSLTRDDMNAVEEYINIVLKHKVESHIRAHNLLKSLEKNKINKH